MVLENEQLIPFREAAQRVPTTSPQLIAQRRSTAHHRHPTAPISCNPSSPNPNMMNGNAVPSLKPASPVNTNRSRSESVEFRT